MLFENTALDKISTKNGPPNFSISFGIESN